MQAMTREEWAETWPKLKANEQFIEAFIRGDGVRCGDTFGEMFSFTDPPSYYTIVPPKKVVRFQPYLLRAVIGSESVVDFWDDVRFSTREQIERSPYFIKWIDEIRTIEI